MTTLIATLLGVAATGLILLRQVALWQRKEYRWDRLWAELKESWWQQPAVWLTVVLAIAIITTGGQVSGIGWLGLGMLLLWLAYDGIRRGLYRPKPTLKAVVILIIAAGVLSLLSTALRPVALPLSVLWLIVSVAAIPAAAVAAVVGTIAGDIRKRQIISRASALRREHPSLQVIGITGSYGKTSTKYFLYDILTDGQGAVEMTTDHRNEAFVVAQDILAHVSAKTATYIVEMAAYRTGEIKRLAQLTAPRIGVVTAIRNQHLALFGSLKNVAAAKWELIEALPLTGIAVLNADDPTIVANAAKEARRIIWYSLTHTADVYVEAIDYTGVGTTATWHIGDQVQRLLIAVAGPGYLAAAAAAAAAAYAVGTPPAVIFQRLVKLTPEEQTMEIITNSRGSRIIDDSYSANEDGVLMAIRHLDKFPHPRKIVVLRPLIELGSETRRVHAAIGAALAAANVEVWLYDMAGAADIEEAARQHGLAKPIHRVSRPKELARMLLTGLDDQTLCLLENRLPDVVRAAALA